MRLLRHCHPGQPTAIRHMPGMHGGEVMNCPYCDRAVEQHPSALGYSCIIHGFIPHLVMAHGSRNEWRPTDTKEDVSHVSEWDSITIGTESKGRLKVMIPVDASDIEAKRRIDQRMTWLHYTVSTAREMGLDILPTKGKKGD